METSKKKFKNERINENVEKDHNVFAKRSGSKRLNVNKEKSSSEQPTRRRTKHQTHPGWKRSTFIKPGTGNWFEQMPTNEGITAPIQISKDLISELRNRAEMLLDKDTKSYKNGKNRGDFAWIDRVLHGGTLADKMAAHTTLLQDSPVHNLQSLDALLALVSTKAKRECIMAMETLKDLFVNNLLPDDRKLRKFELQPLSSLDELSSGNRESSNRRLILWHFEDILRERYLSFVVALDKVSHDSVEKTKQKAIFVITQLLASNPEQEQFLLNLLINKLGDPAQQVAGKVIHSLISLLDEHPNMKTVVAQEIERFLYRPHLKQKAQYYALCCLNQIILDREDTKLAQRLVEVYLGFFRACIKKDNHKKNKRKDAPEVDLRLMSATLTGLSRAAPYAAPISASLTENLNELYTLLPKVPFTVRTQALALLYQVQDSGSERFYCALYRTLLDPGLQAYTRQAIFLNLLYRCLKRDPAIQRVKAFTKRILQICNYLPASLVCSLLVLLTQIFQSRPEVKVMKIPDISGTTTENMNMSVFLEDDDEGEHYKDIPDENEEIAAELPTSEEIVPSNCSSSWLHVNNSLAKHQMKNEFYDPKHRNPLYCMGTGITPYWELSLLGKHFHPSVALFANSLNSGNSSDYCGDPLQDFTLSRFLERFVYRNPKQSTQQQSSTVVETKSSKTSVFGKRKLYTPIGLRNVPVQSQEYLQSKSVPAEERFLYEYRLLEDTKKKAEKDDDADSVTSEDFEAMLDNMEPGALERMDFSSALKKMKVKKTDTEMDDVEDLSDDDFMEDPGFQDEFKDYDEDLEDLEGFEAEDFDKMDGTSRKRKSKKQDEFDLGQLYASAEQFSGMLEDQMENTPIKGLPGSTTTQAVSNRDQSDAKQLLWEQARHHQTWHGKRKKMGQNFRKSKRTKRKV